MRLLEQGVLPSGLANPALPQAQNPFQTLTEFLRKTLVITELEVRKLRHDPTDLVTRAIQPVLWLLIFGQVVSQIRAIPTGDMTYMEFLTPGILAQSVLFISIFYGLAVIWERDLGILQKFLASPTPRTAIVFGKALSAGVRALSQAAIIYVVAFLLGVKLDWSPIAITGVVLVVFLGAGVFSCFSLIIACLVKTRERFMGIGQVLTMPLFFASNAIYPIAIMPEWLQVISRLNPLTYMVDALRVLMLAGTINYFSIGTDVAVLAAVMAVLIWIGARMYPNVVV